MKKILFVGIVCVFMFGGVVFAETSGEALSLQDAFVKVSKDVGPAVVSISTEHIEYYRTKYYPFSRRQNDFFDEFFSDFFIAGPDKEFKKVGLGSGVIFDKEGYVLTNEHVVHGADRITVTLPDGREFEGQLTGSDMYSDLAVVKIEPRGDMPCAKLGDSDRLEIGHWAIAIGNPFGFAVKNPEPTVTVGVVSALHRTLPRTDKRTREYSDLIQTDAPINPGNSGGPLLNLRGEVIGINVAIYTTTGGYQGVGFAIPVDQAKHVMDKLIRGEEVEYGWLGVQIQDLTQEMADYFGLPDRKGALVAKVLKESPAEKSGLKEGDVIRKINGQVVDNTNDLMGKVSRQPVGSQAKCEIIRDKKTLTLVVELGKRPLDITSVEPEPSEYTFRGIKVADLTEELKRRYGVTEDGVIISEILPGSAAQDSGLRPGDIIFEVNKKLIYSAKDFESFTVGLKDRVLIRTQKGYVLLNPDK